MSDPPQTLPPGILPGITDTDPLPLHPSTIVGDGYVGVDPDWKPEPPAVVDVPAVTQAGDTLSCTMGNWNGQPISYAYQWQLDGADAGTDAAELVVTEADVGQTATCTVTATNYYGSTTAPPSNEVVIAPITSEEPAAPLQEEPEGPA